MFNTPTLAENAVGSLAVGVPGTLALCFPLKLGCPAAQPSCPCPCTGTGVAPERLYWITDSSRRLLYWGRVAGASQLELKHLDMAFVRGVTVLRQGRVPARERGRSGGPRGTDAHGGCCTSPAPLAALLL